MNSFSLSNFFFVYINFFIKSSKNKRQILKKFFYSKITSFLNINIVGKVKTFNIELLLFLYYSPLREIAIDKHCYCKHNLLQGSYTYNKKKILKKMLQSESNNFVGFFLNFFEILNIFVLRLVL